MAGSRGAAKLDAAFLGRCKPGAGAFRDHLPLVLGDGGQDV
jgi:hypothetical protein